MPSHGLRHDQLGIAPGANRQRNRTRRTFPSNVWLSAYQNPTEGTVAIVAANNNTSATSVSLFITGAAPESTPQRS